MLLGHHPLSMMWYVEKDLDRHFLHQCPQVQFVSIVAYDRSTWFSPSYLGDARLVVSVEYDGRTTDDVIFDEFVQVAVRPIEDGEVGVRWKVVEQV